MYYRRLEIDEERDMQQETLKKPSEFGHVDWQMRNGKMVKVIRIASRYYFTKYEVQVQVFNEMCEAHLGCEGPISKRVQIMSAEDLPQVNPIYFK